MGLSVLSLGKAAFTNTATFLSSFNHPPLRVTIMRRNVSQTWSVCPLMQLFFRPSEILIGIPPPSWAEHTDAKISTYVNIRKANERTLMRFEITVDHLL